MPLKRVAVPLLDEVSATGTANTVTVRSGRLLGENTDVDGMHKALLDAGVTRAESACVFGACATATTALAVLHALGCGQAAVIARKITHTGELVQAAERIGVNARIRPWAETARHLQASLVVSALPPGTTDPLAPLWPTARNTLLDVVYRPWPTPFAEAARRDGSTVIGGLPMLVHQAARPVELQPGRTPAPLPEMHPPPSTPCAISGRRRPGGAAAYASRPSVCSPPAPTPDSKSPNRQKMPSTVISACTRTV